jgi:predicted RNase H-like HicB family nuclease
MVIVTVKIDGKGETYEEALKSVKKALTHYNKTQKKAQPTGVIPLFGMMEGGNYSVDVSVKTFGK